MFNKRFGIGMLILVILLVGMALIPAVSAQEVSKISEKPSELEQGLIDSLNSNTKNLSTDDVIANYFEANKDKISINDLAKNDTVSDENNSRTYQLKDGSKITFTNGSYFYISGMEEETNNKKITQSVTATTSYSYTPMLTAYKHFYSTTGLRLFSIYARGYYGYNGNTVKAYYYDSWYDRGFASIWQVSNWEEGGYDYASGTLSEIYGRGNFHWGFEYQGIGLVIQDKYITVKSTCDKNGNYKFLWSAN
jgi:hypothetical protein